MWLILLVVFPAFGAGAGGSLFAATLLAGIASWAAGRWFWPRRTTPMGARTPLSAAARLTIGGILAAFLLFALVFVVAGGR